MLDGRAEAISIHHFRTYPRADASSFGDGRRWSVVLCKYRHLATCGVASRPYLIRPVFLAPPHLFLARGSLGGLRPSYRLASRLMTRTGDELIDTIRYSNSAKARDEAISELVNRYKPVIYGIAYNITGKNRFLAEEAFQETFLRVFKWLSALPADEPLHTFPKLLATFARRAAIDVVRKEKHQSSTGSQQEAEAAADAAAHSTWDIRAYVVSLMEKLPEHQRAILRLTYFEELSAIEIGERLGPNQETYESRDTAPWRPCANCLGETPSPTSLSPCNDEDT